MSITPEQHVTEALAHLSAAERHVRWLAEDAAALGESVYAFELCQLAESLAAGPTILAENVG